MSSHNGESEPLLGGSSAGQANANLSVFRDFAHLEDTRSLDEQTLAEDVAPQNDDGSLKRHLGLTSTVFLIFNRIIGTSIFATPSVILRASGSVGLSFVMWLLGTMIAACGTAVYIELGTALPKNGGEKNYLEYIYQRPRFLMACGYAAYALLIGWSAANVSVFGEYVLHAVNPTQTPPPIATRLAGVSCVTFALVIHGTRPAWGIRLQNTLGVLKLMALCAIALSGLAALARMPGFKLEEPPQNFEWSKMWEGSGTGGVSAFVTGLFTVVWAFVGYSNANYALSEVRDPVRTIKLAAPSQMRFWQRADRGCAILWQALGIGAERVVAGIVAMSTFANIMTVLYTQGRGYHPFSGFFASNKPFGAPFAGLAEQWFVTSLLVLTVPPGDAYLFMINMITYPISLINMLVSLGLLYLHTPLRRRLSPGLHALWAPPFRAWTPVVAVFFLSNVFLVLAPLVPPPPGFKVYENLPYWLHVLAAASISLVGVAYWYVNWQWLPRRGGYKLVREWVREDGVTRSVIHKVKL
ncbi:amino acid permease-domain-containing protein [Fomitopsis serialis]|uniref:amino acid permease-domain-containing protein n=1 Tax=Fomitopsis serialis TaxID=139415 RepID=UPI002007A7A3|nr:amino acid permease-domain-containing protein [Neoantrodia serialis]KAH9934982.1 amino acid permease-domain-containing protein [Neoantrodia serialis]